MDYDQRDRIMLASGMLTEEPYGWYCKACGAICTQPGHGHLPNCALSNAVSHVAPEFPSGRQGFMSDRRLDAIERLTRQEIDECDRLACNLLIGDDIDATLKKIGEYCGEGALESGLLRSIAGKGGDLSGVSTLLMCERAFGRRDRETGVTPAVN